MKIDQDDRKLKYVLYKAHENLLKCPFEMDSIADLKNVQGIGENIAVKLDEAWKSVCNEIGRDLTMSEVKLLKNDDLRRFLTASKSKSQQKKDEQRRKRDRESTHGGDEFVDKDENEQPPLISIKKTSSFPSTSKAPITMPRTNSEPLSSSSSTDPLNFKILSCRPIEQPRVILIADNREQHSSRCKSVIEHLMAKSDITVDIRALSVGDYIWVCRKIDGSELVMDWVVERKTWSDLQSSIRGGRYDEQKARLGLAPMTNRIYLIEASTKGDVACEQAVASTLSNGGYLIQRCSDTRDTAAFLRELTIKLQKKASSEEVSGVPFNQLQTLMQKKKAETVKETWTRQLMVCPGMSYSRAEAISDRFPSMPAMLQFFRANGDDSQIHLLHLLPQLTRPIVRNLHKFFSQ